MKSIAFSFFDANEETDMVEARLQEKKKGSLLSEEINRINLRNDLDRADMNNEINK